MKVAEICAKVCRSPVRWVSTIPADTIVVVTIDIRTTGLAGYEESDRGRFVVDEGYHNSSIAELLVDGVDVGDIWPFDPVRTECIFVLSLESDDWATVGDLRISYDLTDVGDVVLCCFEEAGLVGA